MAPLLVLPFDPNLGDPDDASKGGILAAQALLATVLTVIAVGVASDWNFRRTREALRRLGLRRFAPSVIGWIAAGRVVRLLHRRGALLGLRAASPSRTTSAASLGWETRTSWSPCSPWP